MSLPWTLECAGCGRPRGADGLPGVCEACAQPYLVRYRAMPSPEVKGLLRERRSTMWRFREWLPLAEGEEPVTLGEGGPPRRRIARIATRYGLQGRSANEEAPTP